MAKEIAISLEELFSGTGLAPEKAIIGAAVSGGRDSVALLHALKASGVNVVCVNIEHGIRGEESVRDSEFVAALAEEYGIKLFRFDVDAPKFSRENGYTLEQGARILRYRVFGELLKKGECDLIATAHHADDQIETVLMRIIRGTGIGGLAGMRKMSGNYIRPLLGYSREDIDAYVKKHGLKYVEDSTNKDTAYTRNYLREEIAKLKERFPSFDKSVLKLSESAAELEEYLAQKTPEIEVKGGEAYVKTSDCAEIVIAKRLILKAAAALGVTQDIEEKHLSAVLELICAENGKRLDLTHGLCVHKQEGELVFSKAAQTARADAKPFSIGEFPSLGVIAEEAELKDIPSKLGAGEELYIDADKVGSGAVFRRRNEGDKIRKFGGGSKSLGDFLTDKKIPLRFRDELTVLAQGSDILAVVGVDISADVKIDETTKRVVRLKKTENCAK